MFTNGSHHHHRRGNIFTTVADQFNSIQSTPIYCRLKAAHRIPFPFFVIAISNLIQLTRIMTFNFNFNSSFDLIHRCRRSLTIWKFNRLKLFAMAMGVGNGRRRRRRRHVLIVPLKKIFNLFGGVSFWVAVCPRLCLLEGSSVVKCSIKHHDAVGLPSLPKKWAVFNSFYKIV